MSRLLRRSLAGLFALMLCGVPPTQAQPVPPPPPGQPGPPQAYPQGQLDALLAPIALYPDSLLTQVLMASTYPLEVTTANRFMQQNPSLNGAALDQALADKTWDPSVLSLTQFPQVLAMMDDKLEWTQQLGDAFLANQQAVMDTVQSLRARAQAAGNLQSTPQQTVVVRDQAIDIEPAQPQVVYVPVYNPMVIYGPWWVPTYQPWYWVPPRVYGYPAAAVVATGIAFGVGLAIAVDRWGWARPDWRSHNITVNVNNRYFVNRPVYQTRYASGTWQHLPEHRQGVAYRDAGTRDRYQPIDPRAVQERGDFRGHDVPRPTPAPRPGPPVSSVPRPAPRPAGRPQPTFTPAFNGTQNRAQVQAGADRGRASMQSVNRAPVQRSPQRPEQPHGHK
jgi:hypothetical protein